MSRVVPSPLKLIARVLVVSMLVLLLAHQFGQQWVKAILPVCNQSMSIVASEFRVLSSDIAPRGGNQVLRLRANLAQPIKMNAHFILPIKGWYEVTLTVGGVLGYGLLALISILAWPAARNSEMLWRVLLSLPLIGILVIVNVVSTWRAELWAPIYHDYSGHSVAPLLMWSRFLMGGGGYLLGFLCALLAITWAKWLATRLHGAPGHLAIR
jgi:hypothetical protein